MSEDSYADKSVSELSQVAFEALQEELTEPVEGERGGPAARLAALLGFWRTMDGANLRIGFRHDDSFVSSDEAQGDRIVKGDKVNLVMRQLYLPNLPHERCTAQISWQASHWFDDAKSTEVAHITTCDASEAGNAAAVGLPIFESLKVDDGIGLKLSVYVMADSGSKPIIDLLGSSAVSSGLKLGGQFNPVFAMTGPYVQAAIAGLVRASKKNFKLVTWSVGFGVGQAPVPLACGD